MGTGYWPESDASGVLGRESASRQSPVAHSLVGVVLPAGGAGTRLGGAPKQFRRLGDAPILVQSLRAFARHEAVGPVVVAAPQASVEATRAVLDEFGLEARVVAGGATRTASVERGLEALPGDVDAVLVHDAVRPFVSADLIARVIEVVRTTGAAAAAMPVADTLRAARGGTFGPTVDRGGLWAMQTPQGASKRLLVEAYARFGTVATTDEAGLLGLAGVAVAVVEGDARNLKVTTPTDWALAEALWPAWAAGL